MILLADSGSTKTDWCLVDGRTTVARVRTRGTNPFFQSSDEIADEIASALIQQLPSAEEIGRASVGKECVRRC